MSVEIEWVEELSEEVSKKYKIIFENILNQRIRKDRESREFFYSIICGMYGNNIKEIESPIWVGYKVTNQCNLDCIHCWASNSSYQPSYKNVISAIDKLIERDVYFLGLSGGELFLRKDILSILRYAKSKRMILELFTNGILLNDESIKELSDILDEKDIIQVSLDGSTEDIYMKQRRTDRFDTLIKNIKKLVKEDLHVRISYVATNENVADIYNTYLLSKSLGAKGFSLNYVYPKNKGKILSENFNNEYYYSEILRCLDEKDIEIEFTFYVNMYLFEKTNDYIKKIHNYHKPIISTGFSSLYIDADGMIYPEFELDYPELCFGNIYTDTWDVIIKNIKNINPFIEPVKISSYKCNKCKFKNICIGMFYEQSYERYKEFGRGTPYCTLK